MSALFDFPISDPRYPAFKVGDLVPIPWRTNRSVKVTPRMLEALKRARAVLIGIALAGETITYTNLSVAIDRLYPARNMGRLLDLVSLDCNLRNEAYTLPLVVVQAWTGECGSGMARDPRQSLDEARSVLYAEWQVRAKYS